MPVQDDLVPRLAPGVELLGLHQDSESEAPYLYRLPDGQAVQVSRLLHLVATRLDGQSSFAQVARQVTDEVGRRLSPDSVAYLTYQKLRPLGLVRGESNETDQPRRATPLLGLRFRAGLVPETFVRVVARILTPLFLPPVVAVVLGAVGAVDIWLFLVHGVTEQVDQVLYTPTLLLTVPILTVCGGLFHELGHATACRYGGARPGRIGFGLYLIWPVFYSDVTDTYRLTKSGRLRTDLGGVYFNAVFIVACAAAYLLLGWEVLLVALVIQHVMVLQQFLPFVRLDGYYVISDLIGVRDLFSYVKPILSSAIPGRAATPELTSLRRGLRLMVTAWVVVTITLLTATLAILVARMPRLMATTSDSFAIQSRHLTRALEEAKVAEAISAIVQVVSLVLPLIGLALTLMLVTFRAGRGLRRWLRGHPAGTAYAVPPDPMDLVSRDRSGEVPKPALGDSGGRLTGAASD